MAPTDTRPARRAGAAGHRLVMSSGSLNGCTYRTGPVCRPKVSTTPGGPAPMDPPDPPG
jgi:hypothetical protein